MAASRSLKHRPGLVAKLVDFGPHLLLQLHSRLALGLQFGDDRPAFGQLGLLLGDRVAGLGQFLCESTGVLRHGRRAQTVTA